MPSCLSVFVCFFFLSLKNNLLKCNTHRKVYKSQVYSSMDYQTLNIISMERTPSNKNITNIQNILLVPCTTPAKATTILTFNTRGRFGYACTLINHTVYIQYMLFFHLASFTECCLWDSSMYIVLYMQFFCSRCCLVFHLVTTL